MPKINLEVPHQLTAENAKERLQRFGEMLEQQYQDQVKDMEQTWDGDTLAFGFKTLGVKIQGKLVVEEQRVVVDGELPFAAMMFKGKIESEIQKQIEKILR